MALDIWIVIPVKPFDQGKSRLQLDDAERVAVNRAFFEHVLRTAALLVDPARVVIVSHSDAVLDAARRFRARTLREGDGDLNDALAQGAAFAQARGADGVLSLFADLPYLEGLDLAAMIASFTGDNLVIAPDEAGAGTNALLMAPNALPYRHQTGSFWLHLGGARDAAMPFNIVRRSGLMRDIDTPNQFADLALDRMPDWRAQHHN